MRNPLKFIITGQLGHVFTFEGVYVNTVLLLGKDGGCGPRTWDEQAQKHREWNREGRKRRLRG